MVKDTDVTRKKCVNMYISYAAEDENLYRQLRTHIAALQNIAATYQVNITDSQEIGAGFDAAGLREVNLYAANIILLLISSSFLVDTQCLTDMAHAMKQAEKRADHIRTIPIKFRAMSKNVWDRLPVHRLQALPRSGKSISERGNNKDQVLSEIIGDLSEVIDAMLPSLPFVEPSALTGQSQTTGPVASVSSISMNDNIRGASTLKYSDADVDRHLSLLRDEFSRLYDDISDIRTVIFDARIQAGNVRLSGSAKTIWFSILQEAHRRNKVLDLVNVVAHDYPESDTVRTEQSYWKGYYKR